MKSSRTCRGQILKAKAEAKDKFSRTKTRTKFWPRGQFVLEDLTSLYGWQWHRTQKHSVMKYVIFSFVRLCAHPGHVRCGLDTLAFPSTSTPVQWHHSTWFVDSAYRVACACCGNSSDNLLRHVWRQFLHAVSNCRANAINLSQILSEAKERLFDPEQVFITCRRLYSRGVVSGQRLRSACATPLYPNVTTLRSGLCCRRSVCLLSVMSVHPT